MASNTNTANLALGHLGVGTEIANLTTESSEEAIALRRFEDVAIRTTLRDFNWGFAKAYFKLGEVEEFSTTSNEREWGYSYRYPSDCIKLRKIFSGNRDDTHQSRVRYEIGGDDTARLIYTDDSAPIAIYTKAVTNYALFPDDFIMALSIRWALYLPKRLMAGDPFKVTNDLFQMYRIELGNARKNDTDEQSFASPPESEFMRARG